MINLTCAVSISSNWGIVSLSGSSGLVWLNLRVIIVEWMNQRTRIKLRPLSILSIKICSI
jgi:hypothetical protein